MSEQQELAPHLECIRDNIPIGRKNAITRRYLATITGFSDRTLRDCIEDLRIAEVMICNEQDGTGYYIADCIEDIARQYWRDFARAMSILKRLKAFRRALKAAGYSLKREKKKAAISADTEDNRKPK